MWKITEEDKKSLDDYEGVRWNTYRIKEIHVNINTDEEIKAMTYIAKNNNPGKPINDYLEKIIVVAKDFGFPEKYIKELKLWCKISD